jgi:hypothetical protein
VASTPEGRALTQAHRAAQLTIRAAALRDLQQVWRAVDPTNLARTIGPFADASSTLVLAGNRTSAGLSARYVEQLRRLERVPGTASILTGGAPPRQLIAANLRASALRGIINARRSGFAVEAAARNGFVRASGSASSLVLAGGREVVEEAGRSDRRSVGWMRVTGGADPCAYCISLSAAGPTRSQDVHAFHDHDSCTIEPVYDERAYEDRSQWPEQSVRHRDEWDEITGGADPEASGAREAFRAGRDAKRKGQAAPDVDPTIGVEEF